MLVADRAMHRLRPYDRLRLALGGGMEDVSPHGRRRRDSVTLVGMTGVMLAMTVLVYAPAYIENEYKRGGVLQYLAAWDVRRGYVMGRCEPRTGIKPCGRLVNQVLAEEPYRSSERLFWIVDNGSSHRGAAARKRLRQVDSRIILVHTPVHASWLNQVDIYFSIIQRKVLTPNDFDDLEAIRLRLALYEELSNQNPTPFQWKFDRTNLTALLAKIEARQKALADAQLSWLKEAA